MKTEKSKLDITEIIIRIVLVLLAFLSLLPFIHVLAVAISKPIYVMKNEVSLWPKGIDFEALWAILSNKRFIRSFANTVYYMVFGTIISLIMTCLCAYPLNKDFPGKKIFYIMIIITMFFSGGMIPSYLLIDRLGMINTVWAIVLPGAIGTFYVFIMRTYFKSIGVELEESAKIDGASDITVLFRIIIPLSMPVFATIGLFYATGHWNSFFGPLIYLPDRNKQTIQLFLRDILIEQQTLRTLDLELAMKYQRQVNMLQLKYSSVIVSVLPILCLYPVLQKHFTKGLTLGAIKL